MEQCLS